MVQSCYKATKLHRVKVIEPKGHASFPGFRWYHFEAMRQKDINEFGGRNLNRLKS